MKSKPLVSIVVLTYNSGKYILETLESIKEQTYNNIELIITDDASTDETALICKQWLTENTKRFSQIKYLVSPFNVGISANINKGVREANGEWIKCIAGDDILDIKAIQLFIESYKGDSLVIIGDCIPFHVDERYVKVFSDQTLPREYNKKLFTLSAHEQYKKLIEHCGIPAPGAIFRRDIFHNVGYFNENYPMMEDWPFWVKCTKKNYKIDYIPIKMTYYRIGHGSISKSSNTFFNKQFYDCKHNFIKQECNINIPFWKFLYWEDYIINRVIFLIIYYIFNNQINICTKAIYKLLNFFSIRYVASRIKY